MKIATFPSFGPTILNDALTEIKNKYQECSPAVIRNQMALYVKDHLLNIDFEQLKDNELKKILQKNPESFIKHWHYENMTDYLYWSEKQNKIEMIRLTDVDTSKRWTLHYCSGAENVKYLEDPICIDEENNFYEEERD